MFLSPINSIIREATRTDDEPLNILCAPTHEAYETGLAKTGHNFYAYSHQHFKTWNRTYRPVPENYRLLSGPGLLQIPLHVDFDLVLSQNKFGQFQVLAPIAQTLQLPLISLEHTLPVPQWEPERLIQCKMMRGISNVFISEFSVEKWGWEFDEDVEVIHHCIDTNTFCPSQNERKNHILSVVNDWINRDWCCNFNGWVRTTHGLPVHVLGNTPGLSSPATSLSHLVETYQSSRIFYNTSTISPVPTSLLEAMACGCAVVSTATCMIPEIIQNGVNGFLSNDEKELRSYLEQLLEDENLAIKLGTEARKTIENKFSESKFIDNWNRVFRKNIR